MARVAGSEAPPKTLHRGTTDGTRWIRDFGVTNAETFLVRAIFLKIDSPSFQDSSRHPWERDQKENPQIPFGYSPMAEKTAIRPDTPLRLTAEICVGATFHSGNRKIRLQML